MTEVNLSSESKLTATGIKKEESTMNAFELLKTTDRYKELAAIPVAPADHDIDDFLNAKLSAVAVEVDGKDYSLTCYLFASGNRSEFKERVIEL